jgi:hypothetical protein
MYLRDSLHSRWAAYGALCEFPTNEFGKRCREFRENGPEIELRDFLQIAMREFSIGRTMSDTPQDHHGTGALTFHRTYRLSGAEIAANK